jgi:hypothetical protein
MTWYQVLLLGAALVVLAVSPALAHGGGGGGGGGGAGAGVAGGGGHGGGAGHGGDGGVGDGGAPAIHSDVDASGHVVGDGRGTALSAPGSQHRSSKATQHLSNPKPGKAHPPSGVVPGLGKVGTVPTTPGHEDPSR